MNDTDSNLHLVPYSDWDGLTITVTPAAESDLPIENLLDPNATITRISGSPDPITIKGSNTTDLLAGGFALAKHNLPENTTIRVRLYADINQTGTIVYDSTAISIVPVTPVGFDAWDDIYPLTLPNTFSVWFTNVTYKSFQVDIDQPASPIAIIDIGRLFLGFAFTATVNFSKGASIEHVDKSIHKRTGGLGIRTLSMAPYRKFDISINHMPLSDREQLLELLERYGKGRDMLISLDPMATNRISVENTMIAKRISNNKVVHIGPSIFSQKLTFEET